MSQFREAYESGRQLADQKAEVERHRLNLLSQKARVRYRARLEKVVANLPERIRMGAAERKKWLKVAYGHGGHNVGEHNPRPGTFLQALNEHLRSLGFYTKYDGNHNMFWCEWVSIDLGHIP